MSPRRTGSAPPPPARHGDGLIRLIGFDRVEVMRDQQCAGATEYLFKDQLSVARGVLDARAGEDALQLVTERKNSH